MNCLTYKDSKFMYIYAFPRKYRDANDVGKWEAKK